MAQLVAKAVGTVPLLGIERIRGNPEMLSTVRKCPVCMVFVAGNVIVEPAPTALPTNSYSVYWVIVHPPTVMQETELGWYPALLVPLNPLLPGIQYHVVEIELQSIELPDVLSPEAVPGIEGGTVAPHPRVPLQTIVHDPAPTLETLNV